MPFGFMSDIPSPVRVCVYRRDSARAGTNVISMRTANDAERRTVTCTRERNASVIKNRYANVKKGQASGTSFVLSYTESLYSV
jgi:hypothetical protein